MENQMSILEKHIVIALTASTLLILFNIIAVTTGLADAYYSQIEQFLSTFWWNNFNDIVLSSFCRRKETQIKELP